MQADSVPCRVCSAPTKMAATRLCDGCWELNRRTPALVVSVLRRTVEHFENTDAPLGRAAAEALRLVGDSQGIEPAEGGA